MLKYTVLLLLAGYVLCDNCKISKLTALWFKDIDSDPEEFSVNEKLELTSEIFRGKIQLFEDAFNFLIVNQSLPRLCRNSVKITNDLSVFQIRNSGLLTIDPGAFHIVPTLALLKISNNPITTLKGGVFNSLKVKELDLSHNFISVIDDDTFDNITALEIVKLSYNAIKQLSANWFQNSPNIYKLSIIYNELTAIPANAFQHLSKNRPIKLRLSANMIQEIDNDAFNKLADIEVIRLNGNKIKEIPASLFANRIVRILQVNSNKLTCFPDTIFEGGIKSLAFIENPRFNCTCLRKVQNFVENNHMDIWYPAIICEDREREMNIVFNFNKTYEIPILLPSTGKTLLVPFSEQTDTSVSELNS